MHRVALSLVLVLSPLVVAAQSASQPLTVVDVVWRDVLDSRGNRRSVPVLTRRVDGGTGGSFLEADYSSVLRVEEQWRKAKLANDVQAMGQVLSDSFAQTDQNGISRNRVETLQFWATSKVTALNPTRATIRLTDDIAVVIGEESEVSAGGTDQLLITRVYVRSENGWRLLSSTQFLDPR